MHLRKYLCFGLLYDVVSWCLGSGRPCHMALALSWLARPRPSQATSSSPVWEAAFWHLDCGSPPSSRPANSGS